MAFTYKGKEYILVNLQEDNMLAIFRRDHYDRGTDTLLDNPTQEEIYKLGEEGRYEYRVKCIDYFWCSDDKNRYSDENISIAKGYIDRFSENSKICQK